MTSNCHRYRPPCVGEASHALSPASLRREVFPLSILKAVTPLEGSRDLNRMISAAKPFVRGGPLALVGEQPGDQEDLQGHPFVGAALRDLRNASELAAPVAKGESGAAPISSKAGRSFFTTALGAVALRGDVRAVVEAILKRCDRVSIAVKKSNRRRLPGKPMELTAVLFVQL